MATSKILKMLLKLDDKASPALKKTGEQAEKTAKKTKELKTSMRDMGLAVAAVGAAFMKMQQHIANSTNEIVDAHKRTGIATETLAGLRLAAKASGQSFQRMERVLQSYTARVADARSGTADAVDGFKDLGIKLEKSDGSFKGTNAILMETMTALHNMSDSEERAIAATDALGSSGTRLLQAWSDNEGMRKSIDFAREFGVDVGPQATKATADWQAATARLSESIPGALSQMMGGFAAMGGAIDAIGAGISGLAEAIPVLMEAMMKPLQHLMSALDQFQRGDFAAAAKSMASAVNLMVNPAAIVSNAIGGIGDAWDAASKRARRYMELASGGSAPIGGGSGGGTTTTTTGGGGGGGTAKGAAKQAASFVDQVAALAAESQQIIFDPILNDPAISREAAKMRGIIQERLDAEALTVQIELDAKRMETASKISGVAGMVGGGDMTGLMALAGPAGMAAGGIIGGAQSLTGGATNKADAIANAKANAEAMAEGLMATLEALPAILSEVLPDLVTNLISGLLEALPEITFALTRAAFEVAFYLLTEFPFILIEAFVKGFQRMWTTIRDWIADFFGKTDAEKAEREARREARGDSRSGRWGFSFENSSLARGSSFVDRTGTALIHRGEEIIPRNGRGRQRNSMGGGESVNVTINTNVVDSDSIPTLVRLIEEQFGSFGRGSSALFSGA